MERTVGDGEDCERRRELWEMERTRPACQAASAAECFRETCQSPPPAASVQYLHYEDHLRTVGQFTHTPTHTHTHTKTHTHTHTHTRSRRYAMLSYMLVKLFDLVVSVCVGIR